MDQNKENHCSIFTFNVYTSSRHRVTALSEVDCSSMYAEVSVWMCSTMQSVGGGNIVAAFSTCLGVKHVNTRVRFAIKFGRTKHGSREQAETKPQQVSATTIGDATHTTRKSEDEARENAAPRQTAPKMLDSITSSGMSKHFLLPKSHF